MPRVIFHNISRKENYSKQLPTNKGGSKELLHNVGCLSRINLSEAGYFID